MTIPETRTVTFINKYTADHIVVTIPFYQWVQQKPEFESAQLRSKPALVGDKLLADASEWMIETIE